MEKFKDFPCFYYLEKSIDRKSRIQFYSMLAAMFGQTLEQAAQSSEFFAHASSGTLFGGTGYTTDEITKHAAGYFEKPYKDCRMFYRRKAISESGLKENCCVTCPYSHSFLNGCLEHERQALFAISQDRELLRSVQCRAKDFSSMLAISCSNDMTVYPAIPFNRYLFEFFLGEDEYTAENVVSYIKSVSDCSSVPDSVLSSFVGMQLKLIAKFDKCDMSLMNSLIVALGKIRNTKYDPPQIVHAASSASVSKKSPQPGSVDALSELQRLLLSADSMHFVGPASVDEPDTAEDTEPEDEENSETLPSLESFSDASADTKTDVVPEQGTKECLEDLLVQLNDNPIDLPVPDILEQDEDACADADWEESQSDEIVDTVDVCEDAHDNQENSTLQNEANECNQEHLVGEMGCFVGEMGENDSASDLVGEMGCEEEPAQQPTTSATPTVSVTYYRSEILEEEFKEELENNAPDDAPESDEQKTVRLCSVCHGASIADCHFAEEWKADIVKHCSACEAAAAEGRERPFHSSCKRDEPVMYGCALCDDNDVAADCVYHTEPPVLSSAFANVVTDCSDYTMKLDGIVHFIEDSADASSISVECVIRYGLEGLLFYVSGKFYFIGGGTTALAAIKQLFSDAKRVTFFSINPILVHKKLLEFGLRHAKVESVAVKYSLFVGANVLLPPGMFMVCSDELDIYRDIMPQYEWLYKRTELSSQDETEYLRLKRLEWSLAYSMDTTKIVLGSSRYIYGTNALNYRFALFDCGRICREGTLYVVTLDETCKLSAKDAVPFWEEVAGRLASSSLSCMNYAFLLAIGEGISYFSCFEEEAFFDSLMASARAAYKKAYKREVHLRVTCERYITN